MLEEVGFQIGFTPIYWTYATGFPKAMNIGKAVDKRLGKERKVVGKHPDPRHKYLNTDIRSGNAAGGGHTNAARESGLITAPASDEAKKLDGSYAGYQPKPAVEVVIVAMKPLDQKGYLDQALDNQKGVTWLDNCRIPFAGMNDTEQYESDKKGFTERSSIEEGSVYADEYGGTYNYEFKKPKKTKRKPREENTVFKTSGFKSEDNDTADASPLGRFAANLLVSDDVLNVESKGQLAPTNGNHPSMNKDSLTHGDYSGYGKAMKPRNDGNSFSRYYSLDAWWEDRLTKLPEEIQRTFPFLIVPKASKSEKNNGAENNIHPTVKPLKLMSYLVTLGSRKNDVVLDPFMGSGTTPMACVTLSRNYIGIEREAEYFKIAQARVNKLEKPIKQWEQWI